MRIMVDAKATIGMVARKGLGSVKHIEASSLWIQDHVRQKKLTLGKVDTLETPADMLTKNLVNKKLNKHAARLGYRFAVRDDGSTRST